MLATSPADLPSPAVSLEELLWPAVTPPWTERLGLEQLRALGHWLRRLHQATPTAGLGAPEVAELADGSHEQPTSLPPAHWASLQQWSTMLSQDDHLGHGHLGLDHLYPEQSHLVVEATQGLSTAHPAVDVGWVIGDLIELTHRARARGADHETFERLLSAFVTGYRGLTNTGHLEDLDVYRAAALRIALRADTHEDPEDRDLDVRLARHLVEECWRLGLA